MRELTRLVRTGQASDQVVADAIRAAEDPGRDRNTDAYAKHLASYLELDGLFPDAVARLRAASDGADDRSGVPPRGLGNRPPRGWWPARRRFRDAFHIPVRPMKYATRIRSGIFPNVSQPAHT